MKIKGFMAGLASKIVNHIVRKSLGIDIDVTVNELNVTYFDGIADVKLDVNAKVPKETLVELVDRWTKTK